jgi:ubiquinone/menaquinone biosynthesis C-methylase UbiE
MDNDNPAAIDQLAALAALLDPFTIARINDLVDLTGTRCLEIGAGSGSIAVWLADHVGTAGFVLATDVKPHHVPLHPRLGVIRHDLSSQPLPDERYDFIHARLVLAHLPARRHILHRLVTALARGGTLLVEDWDASRTDTVIAAPSQEAARLYNHYQHTVGDKVLAAAGTDRDWARRIHAAMIEESLTEVDTVVHARSWTGGGPGCQLAATNLDQLREQLLAGGMTVGQIEELRPILDDPGLVVAGHLLYSTSGRRT